MNYHSCPTDDVREPQRLEEAARLVVSNVEGWSLIYSDDSDGVDFCVQEDAEHVGVMEVTRHTDEDWKRLDIQLHESETTFDAETEGHWYLDIDRKTGPREIARNIGQISEVLKKVESIGADHYPHHPADPLAAEKLETGLEQLGVPSGYRLKSVHTGRIDIRFGGIGWWMGDEHLLDAVELAISENRKKHISGPGRRHLFLWIEFYALPSFEQLRTGKLPEAPPDLEDTADMVWIAPADPLEGQTSIPLWIFGNDSWRTTEIEIPNLLYT